MDIYVSDSFASCYLFLKLFFVKSEKHVCCFSHSYWRSSIEAWKTSVLYLSCVSLIDFLSGKVVLLRWVQSNFRLCPYCNIELRAGTGQRPRVARVDISPVLTFTLCWIFLMQSNCLSCSIVCYPPSYQSKERICQHFYKGEVECARGIEHWFNLSSIRGRDTSTSGAALHEWVSQFILHLHHVTSRLSLLRD